MLLGTTALVAHRPPVALVEELVLYVLGDQPGDVHLALRPLPGPPATGLDGVLEQGHRGRRRLTPRLEVGEHPGPGIQQEAFVHASIMPRPPSATVAVWALRSSK